MNLKTPMYMVAGGLVIIFLVASVLSICNIAGINLTESACDAAGNPTGSPHTLPSIFFNVGLTGIFMVLIGVMWTIKSYFFA
ncbi:hypothetical protein SAMN04488589_0349 [Methanolobus vulcani]|jgi:uncharacterized membrane protein|uniref:Uncharacterized protein n=1 Tax=Methanolobus vulcani TaxID=38026 RepID=A0A7Z7FDD3_9EURY|nr:hypothetical protein [Methanolobus vulcani]SDF32399.1 hypothetical protein SAMN04488589_0349 [Methanolobus vulcani]